jgi:hypothetical protein
MKRAIFVISAFVSVPAYSHARWKLNSAITPPRSNSTGLKDAPCGGVARTDTARAITPGQMLTVEFEETIQHPGRFEIRLLGPGDQPIAGMTAPLVTVQDDQNGNIANGNNHQFTAQVPIPNTPCLDCSLQLIQVMTENPANPSFYYSCTDVSVGGTVPAKPTGLKAGK